MRIGYFDSMEIMPATTAVKRAVQIAKEALETHGFELIPFNFTIDEQ